MQDRPAHSPGAEPAAQPAAAPADRPFVPAKHYPGDSALPAAAQAPGARPAGGGRVFTRVILPLGLFVAVVAGTAWVVQYLPTWRERRQQQPVAQPSKPALQFEQQTGPDVAGVVHVPAVWDPTDSNYVAEFEFGPERHYDYPFKNPSPAPVQLGVTRKNCICIRKVLVCLLSHQELQAYKRNQTASPSQWQELPIDPQHGITVPPDSSGILRVVLQDRSASGRRNFLIHLWSQAEGKGRDPETVLELSVAFVMPVRYYPEMRDVGRIASGGTARTEFVFW
jgi:hypothetical protein